MLWPLMEILQWLFGVAVRQWLDEVRVLCGAMHARNNVTVIAEKIQSLMRVQQQFAATVTLNEQREEKSMRGTCVRIFACIFHVFVFLLSFTVVSFNSLRSSEQEGERRTENGKWNVVYLQSSDLGSMASPQKYRMHTLCPAPMTSRSIFWRRI